MSVTIEDLLSRALKYLDLVEPANRVAGERLAFAKDRVLDVLDRLRAAPTSPPEPVPTSKITTTAAYMIAEGNGDKTP